MEKVRIQDDLYNYVNGEWLEKAVIPDDKPSTGGFNVLNDEVEKQMIDDLDKMEKEQNYLTEHMKWAVKLYSAVKDIKRRKKDGIKPALKSIKVIEKLNSVNNLNKHLSEFVLKNFPLPFTMSVEENMKDTSHYCLNIAGPSVILPDATYYKEENEEKKKMLISLWTNMAKAVLSKTKLTEEEINTYINDTLEFDERLAKLVKTSEEWSEYTKMYNPMKLSKVCSMVKPIKFKKLLTDLFGTLPEVIIVNEPRYFKGFKEVFNEESFYLYKHWAYVTELIGSCSVLSEELREIGGSYKRALSGIASMSNVSKFAYNLTSSYYSEPMGLYYGETYFGEEAKKDITNIVMEIIDTYKERIKKNDFLEPLTKEKAILKLSTMRVKMGYPDKVDPYYDTLVFDENLSLYDICASLSQIRTKHKLSLLYTEVNRDKWVMPGHMVNACYNPSLNDITFPAAILQAPFYSIKQTKSENLGGIGAVIGHEISHAFDNNGAKCDELGNLNNWWTKEDNKRFNNKTKAMIKEFDQIELPWGKVNGAFTVSENIADNGGMAVTLDIMSKMKEKSYEEYFMNWGRIWCMKAKTEFLQLLLAVDVHGPAILRANMQPRNFDEWYETFNVKKTDKMYLPVNKRVHIW